jgi:excisionase family DNA binding protein
MHNDEITFNDIPQLLAEVVRKLEGMGQDIRELSGSMKRMGQADQADDPHKPMTVDEACEFLRMRKPTLYQNIRSAGLPATRCGKHYILFRDELLGWMEARRTNGVPYAVHQLEESVIPRTGRKIESKFK